MPIRLLSTTFAPLTRDAVYALLRAWLPSAHSLRHVVTLNPEMVMEATAHPTFANVVNHADVVTADGFGIRLACRFVGGPVPERVTGNDLVQELGRLSALMPVRVYLLGAQRGVAHRAAASLLQTYPRMEVVGAESGYRWNGVRIPDRKIVDHIRRSGANVLLVAFGAPKQELWIARHRDALPNVRVAIGVGSAFDYLAGMVRRAPRVMQRTGLEWLWRLLVQPWRMRRIVTATIAFPWAVVRAKSSSTNASAS